MMPTAGTFCSLVFKGWAIFSDKHQRLSQLLHFHTYISKEIAKTQAAEVDVTQVLFENEFLLYITMEDLQSLLWVNVNSFLGLPGNTCLQ